MERLFPCDSFAKPPSVNRVTLEGARPRRFSRGDWLLKGTDERYHSRVDRHRLAELRSIAMHDAIAARLRAEPALVEKARERVQGWLKTGEVHPAYARAWAELLSRPLDLVCAALVDPGVESTALRQCTPFAGILDAPARWRIWRSVGEQASR